VGGQEGEGVIINETAKESMFGEIADRVSIQEHLPTIQDLLTQPRNWTFEDFGFGGNQEFE
jgi:hypothetical protein